MHRQGHFGIVLLALAPVLYVLLESGYPFIALFACGVIVIEPLPDNDFWVPGLTHRGISHTFLTASVIGALCAGFGWVCGTHLTVPVANWLIETILIDPTVITWVETHLAMLDADSLAVVGSVCISLVTCSQCGVSNRSSRFRIGRCRSRRYARRTPLPTEHCSWAVYWRSSSLVYSRHRLGTCS